MIERLLKGYYWATPLFWLADSLWGINVRAAGFQNLPHLKHLYYGICIICALSMWMRPLWTSIISLLESSVNILALILGVFMPILGLAAAVDGNGPVLNPITPFYMLNFCLAGATATAAFYGSLGRITKRV